MAVIRARMTIVSAVNTGSGVGIYGEGAEFSALFVVEGSTSISGAEASNFSVNSTLW